MSQTVLVTGATGFVGSHLARELVKEGYDVRAMTRHPDTYQGAGEPVHGDVFDAETLEGAMAGVDVAYYLVHSLDENDFVRLDAEAATAFGKAAKAAGVRQIIYLGGLGVEGSKLSPHLQSRRQVESLLGEAGVPVTVLRAAIVVGHGGISWEITRQLVKNLPAMVAPQWVGTKTQPISLPDVIRYLVGVLDNPDALDRVFEIGGSEVLTYRDMLRRAAKIQNGRDVPIVVVPMLTPQLSSQWLALVTDVDARTGRNLIESMDNEVVVHDDSIREVVPFEPQGYDDMVREALADRLRDQGAL
jgi:uncharacterized protein YbjT (DUF2867 family)